LTLGCGISRDFNFVGRLDFDGGGRFFGVRLRRKGQYVDLQFLMVYIELAISRVDRVRSGSNRWQENIYGNIPYWLVMIKGPQKPFCVFSPFFAVGVEKRRKYWKEREVFCW
jgi:hypothetical protein